MTRTRPDTARSQHAGRRPQWRLPVPLGVALLAVTFGIALLAPLPTAPNAAQADVVARVEERLPGWDLVRTQSSWEGAWTVVAACGSRHVGFQYVPGHGLGPGDAWLHPEDEYTRTRLTLVSDHRQYLVWFDDEGQRTRRLTCRTELARAEPEPRRSGLLD